MQTVVKQVLEHAAGLPEGTPLVAQELLHLGSRADVNQVMLRLVQLGPEKPGEALHALRAELPPAEMKEVASAHARLPTWTAQEASALVPHG